MKVLWVETMDTAAVQQVLRLAKDAGAGRLAIRSTSQALPLAIAGFQQHGIEVYAWRWPAIAPGHYQNHWFADDEAAYVADTLIPAGLDGYIVDPECDKHGTADDWDETRFEPLAERFCTTIRKAADQRGGTFKFGVTSGCAYPDNCPNIPWSAFVSASDQVFPQSYWRVISQGEVKPANGGSPASAIARGLHSWSRVAQGKPIVPMAGELQHITPQEVADYGKRMDALGLSELHFYPVDVHVDPAVLDAIAKLPT